MPSVPFNSKMHFITENIFPSVATACACCNSISSASNSIFLMYSKLTFLSASASPWKKSSFLQLLWRIIWYHFIFHQPLVDSFHPFVTWADIFHTVWKFKNLSKPMWNQSWTFNFSKIENILNSLKLVSRKIWVVEKFLIFHFVFHLRRRKCK